MKANFRTAVISAGLVLSVLLTACSGTQNGVLPSAAAPSHALKPQILFHCPLSGCNSSSNDGNIGAGGSVTNPGPMPGEVGCSPGDGCGLIARRTPVQGANCWGSPGTLGDNIPQSSTDPATQIDNIYALQANNAAGQLDTVGWVYQTPGGEYIQENLGFQDFWGQLFQAIPGLSGVATALNIGGIAPIASSTEQTVQGYLDGHNGKVGSCFTSALPA